MNHAPLNPPDPFRSAHPKSARGNLRHLVRLAVAIAAVTLLGCDPRATDHRVIGVVIFDHPHYPDWPLPQIPAAATAGVPLEMTIWTMTGCDHRQGDTEVTVLGRSALVIPYDILTTYEGGFPQTIDEHPGYCWQVPGAFEHKATVVFEEPGTAEIILVYSTDGGHLPEYFKADGRKVYTVEVAEAESG